MAASTLLQHLSGLNRILKEMKAPFNIFDKENPSFRELHLTLDSVTSTLHREGIGVVKNSAAVISFEDEELFWSSEVFGYHSPKALQRAVFYHVGLHLVLRGVQEQHDLELQQLDRFPSDTTVYTEDVYYEYHELISKNNQHRFKDINATIESTKVLMPRWQHSILH